jgi:LuxR family maltose regulon positive regulatory protein
VTVAPAAPRLIDRGDLLAALDRAAASKVTVISAPAGSGKTSLLRAWASRPGQQRRLALVQVQRDQHDAQQFWLALLGAVRHATGANSGAELPAATPDFNAPAMVGRVLSELADAHGGVTLVIDDLHEMHSPEAPTQLTRLLTNLPPNVHAVLTTRHDVRLRLHQLRLAGELAEIRAADLRFSERETRELLEASGIALSAAGAALLHQRTEGWAAGLRLAALSLVGHPDRSGSSPSSPAATAQSPSTCSPKCSTASRPTSRICCCAPPCLTGSTGSWPICSPAARARNRSC